MQVREILKNKGPEVFTIHEEKTIADAMKILVANRIGVLLVLNTDAHITGIISERDIIRKAHEDENFRQTIIKNSMTSNIIFVDSDDNIEYVEQIMTNNRIRHLPVLNNKVLAGMISIGDIVKTRLSGVLAENKYLMDYITGTV